MMVGRRYRVGTKGRAHPSWLGCDPSLRFSNKGERGRNAFSQHLVTSHKRGIAIFAKFTKIHEGRSVTSTREVMVMGLSHRFIALCPISVLATGWAHLPDADVQYGLPKSKVSFKVVQTVMCDASNRTIVTNIITPSVKHSTDTSAGPQRIHLHDLKGAFSDTDEMFVLFEDGCLKTISSTNSGQGETVLKSIITVSEFST
jgi:hypothetical protein